MSTVHVKPVVLFVEDENLVRLTIAEELRDEGFEVLEAAAGESAIDVLKSNPAINLLVTDIRMPGKLDGWDVAEQARGLRPTLPVIYATGYSDGTLRVVEHGRFLKKPYTATTLIAIARDLGVSP